MGDDFAPSTVKTPGSGPKSLRGLDGVWEKDPLVAKGPTPTRAESAQQVLCYRGPRASAVKPMI